MFRRDFLLQLFVFIFAGSEPRLKDVLLLDLRIAAQVISVHMLLTLDLAVNAAAVLGLERACKPGTWAHVSLSELHLSASGRC